MNLSAPGIAMPGDQYLVDVGALVRVVAVSPRSALQIAMTGVFGPGLQCPPEHPMVYQIDSEGELIAVYE
jgi:hypothetical protein